MGRGIERLGKTHQAHRLRTSKRAAIPRLDIKACQVQGTTRRLRADRVHHQLSHRIGLPEPEPSELLCSFRLGICVFTGTINKILCDLGIHSRPLQGQYIKAHLFVKVPDQLQAHARELVGHVDRLAQLNERTLSDEPLEERPISRPISSLPVQPIDVVR